MAAHEDSAAPKSVFDAAKEMAETLAGMQKPDQERALRWVAESLGIAALSQAGPQNAPAPYAAMSSPAGPAPGAPAARPKDIKTFVAEKQPKTDNQYAAVVAYYYRFDAPESERRTTINADALQESTRLSDWKRLAAPRVVLSNATGQGYLDRTGRGEYQINTVGENLVAMTLPGGADDGAGRARARKARKETGKPRAAKKARRGKNE